MGQFRIAVTDSGKCRFFNITPLGNSRYELFIEEDTIGTIQLDESDHTHCESQGCELDMPLLNSIRDAIFAYEN